MSESVSDPECLFCRIVAGEIPADRLYEDDEILAFRDVNPQAPFHALIIPKTHIATLNDATPAQATLLGRLMAVATGIAVEQGFAEAGYRTVMNCNSDGGQSVYHIHLHLLAGRRLAWPPG
ncbi:MAG: histidine triad nucleotide-binding protein [Gammaproteobacteria bacterium]|nr:histidine triad nucleotide-binding protein [Gammaproteobacteria bacterium]TVQ48260.1 MAG: histidine triad nucleotide-binding protein [Gammaproteobacteria bacterium]